MSYAPPSPLKMNIMMMVTGDDVRLRLHRSACLLIGSPPPK